MDNPSYTLHLWSYSYLQVLQIRPLAFFRQTDNYPPDVAALSKKMVQATLEIYKNTLWASDCWDWDLPCGHLWKPNRTPPHSSEWMCMVAWHLRLVDIAVNSWHGIASLAEELSSQRIIFQASSGCGHRNRSGRMSCGRHLWRTGGGLCKCEVWQDQVLQRMDDVNYANDSGTTANIIQIIPKCKSQWYIYIYNLLSSMWPLMTSLFIITWIVFWWGKFQTLLNSG